MKKTIFLLGILLITCCLACKEVIQMDLKNVPDRYVIEANLSTQSGEAELRLIKTKKLSAGNTFEGISGATVTISDENGNPFSLLESNKKGIYTHPTLVALPGKKYRLEVKIAGNTFYAESTAPQAVAMQDAYPIQMNLSGESKWYSQVKFKDPAGIANFYRFIEHRSVPSQGAVFVTSDELSDGKQIVQTFFSSEHSVNSRINAGETVRLEFQCIDEAAYQYWMSLSSGGAKGNADVASPSNPISNIKGGAIGYFSAHTTQSKTFVVK
jgi:hypothetical protein